MRVTVSTDAATSSPTADLLPGCIHADIGWLLQRLLLSTPSDTSFNHGVPVWFPPLVNCWLSVGVG